MGKHANERAYRDWERQQDRKADEHLEPVEQLSEAEKAAGFDDAYWTRLDAEVDHFART